MQKILFLDMDGVLNGGEWLEGPQSCKINPENVKHLNKILDTVSPNIVLSSAWRYMIIQGNMTIKGFENMLRTHGVNCVDLFHSCTCPDEMVKGRANQITHWLSVNGPCNYVVVDDMWIEGHPAVRTDFNEGLTEEDADRVIQLYQEKQNA